MFTFLLEMMAKHQNTIAPRLGSKWLIDPQAIVDIQNFTVQPTGSGSTTDPQMLGQKLNMLMQLAMQPGSNIDPKAVEEKIIDTMDFPFDTKKLMYGPQNPPPPPPQDPPTPLTVSISGKLEDQPPEVAHAILDKVGLENPNAQPGMDQVLQGSPGMGADQGPPQGQGDGTPPQAPNGGGGQP